LNQRHELADRKKRVGRNNVGWRLSVLTFRDDDRPQWQVDGRGKPGQDASRLPTEVLLIPVAMRLAFARTTSRISFTARR
jgi:hypothetical protein